LNPAETLFAVDGHVASLTFNRPDAKNAMTWTMYDALVRACDEVDDTPDIRALVLRGSTSAFAAGTDIRQFTENSTRRLTRKGQHRAA